MHPLSQESLDGNETLHRYYGIDRLVLLPRDPYWIYAYWEINSQTLSKIESKAQKSWNMLNVMLRVYRLDILNKNEEGVYDINITPTADNWYINTGVPDKKYRVELGIILNGDFYAMLSSNTISTPRDDISNVIDENWKLTDWHMKRLYRRISLHSLSSPERLIKEKKFQIETRVN